MAQPDLLTELARLPAHWHFVAVDGEKRPYQRQWERRPLDQAAMARQIASGKARGIGVQLGPASGLMAVDLDGPSAADELTRLGVPLLGLPMTWAVTSGRPGRQQLLFTVAPDRQDGLRPTKRYPVDADKQRVIGDDGKAENLDLRWTGQQSIVAGAHPLTGAYRWVSGCSPDDLPLAEAPDELLNLMRRPTDPEPQPDLPPPPISGTVPLIDFVTRDSRSLIETGGTPGAWNDDHLRLALDLQGTEAWLLAQGVRPDVTAEDLFRDHCSAAARLSPDFDRRKAMRRFAGAAKRNPRPGTPEAKLLDRLRYHLRGSEPALPQDQLVEITESPRSPVPSRRTRDPLDGMPFRCLGFDRGQYFYLPDHSRQIVQLSPAQHSRNYLISIAPLDLWSARFGTVNDKKEVVIDWTAATDAMINACIAEGVYDPGRLRGRGAWIDDERVIFHLGDRMLIDGSTSPVMSPPGSRFFYEQGRHADGPSDAPLSDGISREVAAVADRFSWQVPAYSNLLLGWIVLAPVCGTLQWRPHIWITGSAGTGKTTVLRDFLRPLMGGIYETATAGTTEAGLRGQLRSDAIPVVFDEFEQNTASDKAIVQNVLQLARVASSDGGRIYKGTTTGGSVSYDVKSMFCVCSINVALIQKADADRFCVLSLRKDPALKDEAWRDLEAAVHAVCTVENGRALVARTMANILTISANAVTFNRALATRFGQRFADQHAPLLAGAWSLQAMGGQLISPEMASQWINSMDWEQGQADVGDVDEVKCRDAILQSLVRHPGGDQASLGEMVRAVALQQSIGQVTWPDLAPVLARHGLRVFRRGQLASEIASGELQCHYLAIANRSVQLQALLAQTPWSGGAHKNSLRRLDGAIATGPIHFSGVGSSRSVAIPISDSDIS